MHAHVPSYVPIPCEYHDHLEAMATTRKAVRITFTDAMGAVRQDVAPISNLYARDGAEYLVTRSGETIRLDRILAVEQAHPANR